VLRGRGSSLLLLMVKSQRYQPVSLSCTGSGGGEEEEEEEEEEIWRLSGDGGARGG